MSHDSIDPRNLTNAERDEDLQAAYKIARRIDLGLGGMSRGSVRQDAENIATARADALALIDALDQMAAPAKTYRKPGHKIQGS